MLETKNPVEPAATNLARSGLEVRVISATGVCGSGFKESSIAAGMARQPHFIGCDAGSTDPGPAPLGTGTPAFPSRAVKRDLRLMLKAARQTGVPLLVGSAGTAGGEPHLALVRNIVLEIAQVALSVRDILHDVLEEGFLRATENSAYRALETVR